MKFFIFLLAIIPLNLMGQQNIDSDGDGVDDVTEFNIYKQFSNQKGFATYFNPFVSDLPVPSLTFNGSIDIGIEYQKSSKVETKVELSQINFQSNEKENYKKTYSSNSIKNVTEVNINTGFKMSSLKPTDIFGGFEIKNNFKVDATSGIEIRKEEIDKWKNEYKKLDDKIKTESLTFDSKSGYVRANLMLYNPSSVHKIKISKIVFNAYSYNPFTKEKDDKPLFSTREATLLPIGSSTKENSVELDKNELKNRLIEIKELNSDVILELMEQNKSILFEIESYEVSVSDNILGSYSLNSETLAQSIWRQTFTLRIFDGEEDNTYYIAKKDSLGNFINLKQALHYIYPDSKIQYEKNTIDGKEVEFIYNLNEKISDLNTNINPTEYTNVNLSQGFWFKLIKNSSTFDGSLNTPLDQAGIDVTLVFLKGSDLKVEPKSTQMVGSFEDELSHDDPVNTGLNVNLNDYITLEITPYSKTFTQTYTTTTFTSINACRYISPSGITIPLSFSYNKTSISENWDLYKYDNKKDLKNSELYIKFDGLDKLFSLADFTDLKFKRKNPNIWIVSFKVPDELISYKNYPLLLIYKQNNYKINPSSFDDGIIQSDYENLRSTYYNPTFAGQCSAIYDEVKNLLNSNFYKKVTKFSEYKINVKVAVTRK